MAKSTLYIKQQGAGNGKTYGIIQMLDSDDFAQYRQFILVTKQHSAKYIGKTEFMEQYKAGKLKNIKELAEKEVNKKFIFEYKDGRDEIVKSLIVATIDSLVYALGDHSRKGINMFETLVNGLVDGDADSKDSLQFGGQCVELSGKLCLVVDETQDLSACYGRAIVRIMQARGIDAYVVGDKLQSIMYENNAFTYLCDGNFEPSVQKVIFEPINICRRFRDSRLINFVNGVIDFEKYELRPIENGQDGADNNNPVEIFFRDSVGPEMAAESMDKDIAQIMTYYEREVVQNGRRPNDFLIITPFTRVNPLVNMLETELNIFWRRRTSGTEFTTYAFFHKSEEGTSINLDESKEATRIVSIHASKGDGRPVVFVLGMSEAALKKFDRDETNSCGLIYESLLHVAITRQKEKLYIRLDGTPDNIYTRLENWRPEDIRRDMRISCSIPATSISQEISDKEFADLREKFDGECYNIEGDNKEVIIDMRHHVIRYYSMIIQFYMQVRDIGMMNDARLQLREIFKTILNMGIIRVATGDLIENHKSYRKRLYIITRNYDGQISNEQVGHMKIPIMKLSDRQTDLAYYNIISECVDIVLAKIRTILDGKSIDFCPYECVILAYLISTSQCGIFTDITMMDLYYITAAYHRAFTGIGGHTACICGKIRELPGDHEENALTEYIAGHYEMMQGYKRNVNEFTQKHPNMNYLVEYPYKIGDCYHIGHSFKALAYNDKEVFIFDFKPQINALNINTIILNSIVQAFMIRRVKKVSEESFGPVYDKFANKVITTAVIGMETYYELKWTQPVDLIAANSALIKETIRKVVMRKYLNETVSLYDYLCRLDARGNKPREVFDKFIVMLEGSGKIKKRVPVFLRELFGQRDFKKYRSMAEMPRDVFNDLRIEMIKDSIERFADKL